MEVSWNISASRVEVKAHLNEILGASGVATDMAEVIASNMEKGIFNAAIAIAIKNGVRPRWNVPAFAGHGGLYYSTALRVISNIDPTSYVKNATVLPRILDKMIMPHEVPFLVYADLFPDVWSEEQEKINKKLDKAYEVSFDDVTTKYTCGRCKKNLCRSFDIQLKCGDEGTTTFVECVWCKRRWKFG